VNLLVKNGRVVDPARNIDTVTDILIRDGKIRSIGKRTGPMRPSLTRPVSSLRRDFSISTSTFVSQAPRKLRPIATGGAAAVAGGFVAVAAMPNTKPPNDNPSITSYIVSEARRSSPALVVPDRRHYKRAEGRDTRRNR
jgi:dihydroorotase